MQDPSTGATYYYSEARQRSSWTPHGQREADCWEPRVDPKSGQTYYHNQMTKRSTWTAHAPSEDKTVGRTRKGSRFDKKKAAWRGSVFQQSVIREGYLEKKSSGMVKQWQRRYFELSGHYLKYYEDKATKSDETLKGTIDAHEIGEIGAGKGGAITIVMSDDGAKINLRAPSEQSAAAWVDAIEGARTTVAAAEGAHAGEAGDSGAGGGSHGDSGGHGRRLEALEAARALLKEEPKEQRLTDAGFLVELRDKVFPEWLKDREGWSSLTEETDLSEHKLDWRIDVNEEGRVTGIGLEECGLEGPFPFARLHVLDKLQRLWLQDNQLSGQLPEGLGAPEGGCCPELKTLHVKNNKGIGGEICKELMMKKGVGLFLSNSGKPIRTCFLYGVTLASETIPMLLATTDFSGAVHAELAQDGRLQPKVPTIGCAQRDWEEWRAENESPSRTPEHRCVRTGEGSQGHQWNPWQPIWADGLDTLGESGREVEDVYVVCHAEDFKQKLRAGDIVDDGQQYWSETHPGKTKWQMDDFDPAFGLEGEVSDSILDWERRTILRAAAKHPNLRIRYIDPTGEEEAAPAWYTGAGD
eukprot:g1773.t1